MGSAKDTAVKAYIKLPKRIRKYTDPLVKNRAKTKESFEKRAEKGKQIIKDKLMLTKKGKRGKRRR